MAEFQKRQAATAEGVSKTSSNKLQYEQKKANDAAIRKSQNQLKKIEQLMEDAQKRLEEIEEKLALPDQYQEQIEDGSLYKEYEHYKNLIAEQELEWLEASEQMEALMNNLQS